MKKHQRFEKDMRPKVSHINEVRCKKHPKYQGKIKPKVDCLECFKVYSTRLYNEFFK